MISVNIETTQSDARFIPQPDGKFQTIVTSPPYFGLRSYGDSSSEIGIGSVDDYLSSMEKCSIEWKRVLADDGLLWLNVGDTASGSGGAGGDYNSGGNKDGKPKYRQGKSGRAKMQWLNIPHRVVEVFVETGWLYRSCITWDKGMMRPEDLKHSRRPGVSSEFIFMFAKNRNHRFFPDRLTEKGNVWHFSPERKKDHIAPFPEELPRRCIEVSSEVGDWVLDPFSGSNTTLTVAASIGRNAFGCDLYGTDSQRTVQFE
jgi:site-specific DNA-methyltransferase (cytosine-N4-specific)